jgi:N-acetyl-gamma-glutamyl-phosphate reductase
MQMQQRGGIRSSSTSTRVNTQTSHKPGNHLQTQKVAGKIFCDLGLSFDSRTGRITVFSVIDNLGKGASGQAIQNLNLLFGMEETAGLLAAPTYP